MTDIALNTEATQAKAAEIADPFSPIFASEDDTWKMDPGCADKADLGEVLRQGKSRYSADAALCEATLAVALALLPRLAHHRIIPGAPSEHAELQWSRCRCWFAGLGYAYHKPIYEAAHKLTPWCPVEPEESRDEWEKANLAAHYACGWPLAIILARWNELHLVAGHEEDPKVCDWHKITAEAHLLKHVRFDALAQGGKPGGVITYRGEVNTASVHTDTSRIVSDTSLPWLAGKLGAGSVAKAGEASPLDVALVTALRGMPVSCLLTRRPLADLPPQVFVSPGACLAPALAENGGFFQHGLTLDGVRLALCGKVRDYRACPSSPDDVLGYAWAASASMHVRPMDQAQWEAAIPAEYAAQPLPSAILAETFPNLCMSPAQAALFDAVLIGNVLRASVPSLAYEFPLLCFLPTDPSPEGSTKQGKSTCAEAVLRAISPTAEYLQATPSTSGVSIRNLNMKIAAGGSLGMDEFRLGTSPESPMHRDRLQALCTGQAVDVAQVYSNVGKSYRLQACMVLSAKFLDIPEDLVNRFLPFWMDRLPDGAWKDQDKFLEAKSGKLAARMRLAAVAVTEADDGKLGEWLASVKLGASEKGLRFPAHRMLAGLLLANAEGEEIDQALTKLDAHVEGIADKIAAHLIAAQDSGLVAAVDDGSSVARLSLDNLVEALDERGMKAWHAFLTAAAKLAGRNNGRDGGVSSRELLHARAAAANAGHQPGNTPLCETLRSMIPQALYDAPDRSVQRSFVDALKPRMRAAMKHGGLIPFPGLLGLQGWRLGVREGGAGRTMFWTECENPAVDTKSE